MSEKGYLTIHPGEILQEEFLRPMGISQSQLARDIDVPHRRINEICVGKRAITTDTALRLSAYFGTSPEFWMNLQTTHDLHLLAHEHKSLYEKLPRAPRAA